MRRDISSCVLADSLGERLDDVGVGVADFVTGHAWNGE